MATSYEDFSTIQYQGREYYVVYIDPQNLFYGGEIKDDYGNVISGELKQDYTAPEGDQIGEDGQDKRPPESLRDGTTPEKALASFPDDLRCPIMPRTRHLTKELLNNMNSSSEPFSIPTSAYFDGNKYGVCYLIKRTEAYTGGAYTNAQRKASPAINYDVPLYPHNETYSANRDRNVPYSLRNIMFLGCPKETDELWYLLPDELKTDPKWGASPAERAHIYVDITPDGYPNIVEDSSSNSSTIKVDDSGNNEFAIIHIQDSDFQSIVINRCYIYRKCKQHDTGTYGMRGIFDIFNGSNRSSTNCIIQNSKFGFCELTSENQEGTVKWTEEHWNFENDNWTRAKHDILRARRYFKIESYRNCRFDNNIINYLPTNSNGCGPSSDDWGYMAGLNCGGQSNPRMFYNSSCKWMSFYGSQSGGIRHYGVTSKANSDGITLGPKGTAIQALNNKLCIMTAPSKVGWNTDTDTARASTRAQGYCLNISAYNKTGQGNFNYSAFYERSNAEIYGLTVKYIFNKATTHPNYVPQTFYINGFNKTIIKNIVADFQKDEGGNIIDAVLDSPVEPEALALMYDTIFEIAVSQFDIKNIDIKLPRCWYIRNWSYASPRVLYIKKWEEINRRKDLGRVETISDLSVYMANGTGESATASEGHGQKNLTTDYDTQRMVMYLDFRNYGKQIVRGNGISVSNYWGPGLYARGIQLPDSSCRIYGTFESNNTVGTIEFVKSYRTGNVLNTGSGSVIRVKKVLVDVSDKTNVTPIIKNWPTDNRYFGEADNPNSRAISNDAWRSLHGYGEYITNLGDNAMVENGAYLLIDRCNKVVLSDIEFQSTAYGDNFYGITCLNENDRTFDLTTEEDAVGNGRYVQRTKNYYVQPFSIRRKAGSQASLLVSNRSGDSNTTECVIGRIPFKGIQVRCVNKEGEQLQPGRYKLELFCALKNWRLSSEFLEDVDIEGMEHSDPKFVDQYILDDFKNLLAWEAVVTTTLDENNKYEKIYSSVSDGYYEMKEFDDHAADMDNPEDPDYEWEWEGDKFINTYDYRFKSTIILNIEDPSQPINVRLHFNTYNAQGGSFYCDPGMQLKPLE